MMNNDCCLFVSSSDNTFDVFSLLSENLLRRWNLIDIRFYVGLNSKIANAPFETISSNVSDWRNEIQNQIMQLPLNFKYVILVLDDFYFHENVSKAKFSEYLNIVRENKIGYLRLKQVERSIITRAYIYLKHLFSKTLLIHQLNIEEPYYSSLQVSIWSREHLVNQLSKVGSIWQFEHLVDKSVPHYAVNKSLLSYEHLVEKGRWFKYALHIIRDPNALNIIKKRGFVEEWKKNSKLFSKFKFNIFGYSGFKFRRLLNKFQ